MMRRSASRTEMVSSRLVCTLLAVALGLTTTPRHAEAWIRTIAGELPIDDAARMLVDVTHTYLLEFRPPLQQVTFVLRDRAMAVAFREAASERGMLLI